MSCSEGTAARQTWGGIDCCTSDGCGALLSRDACTLQRVVCPSGACDDRRLRCNAANLHALSRPDLVFNVGFLCAGAGRREGDACGGNPDCVPQVEGAPGRLRCATDTRTCVRGPRPTTPTGSPCVWDEDCAEGERCDCGEGGARVCVRAPGADAGAGDAGDAATGG